MHMQFLSKSLQKKKQNWGFFKKNYFNNDLINVTNVATVANL